MERIRTSHPAFEHTYEKLSVVGPSVEDMDQEARQTAEQLRTVDELRRFAEAHTITLMCDLAEQYQVHYSDVVEVLAERRVVVGGIGSPAVSEFIGLELAGLLRCPPIVAASKLADALNLRHRHPRLFAAMQQLKVEAARACKAADLCSDLPVDVAELVTDEWVGKQEALGWTAALNLLKRLIVEADPARAADKERRRRAERGVYVWGLHEGAMNLTGCLDVLDARYLDAAVDRVADILAAHQPGQSKSALRAKALGVLANPAYALALLQQAAQPGLTDPDPDQAPSAPGAQRHDPHCLGALCGTITTPLANLRPRLELAVHVHTDAVGRLTGSARIDKAGHITTALLAQLLPDVAVTVQPVIDLAEVPAEDRYVPSVRLRKALMLTLDHEVFPYSHKRAAGLDLDHTQPFTPGQRHQTRIGNLAPLTRRTHRAKTAQAWRVRQPSPGKLNWTSPLGFAYEVTTSGTRMLRPLYPPSRASYDTGSRQPTHGTPQARDR